MKKTNLLAAAAALILFAGCTKKDAGTASTPNDGAAWKPAKDVSVHRRKIRRRNLSRCKQRRS